MDRPSNNDMRLFRMNVDQQPGGCWVWTGRFSRDGYPTARLSGREQQVHRWSLWAHKGEPPQPGWQAGHTCHDRALADGTCQGGTDCPHRACVNPAHLSWQSPSENVSSSDHHKRRVTHCPAGHPYDAENTRIRRGRRECISCDRERSALRRTRGESEPRIEV